MAFRLSIPYKQAVKAYELQASLAGIPISRIRQALSRREASGNWHLSDGSRIVAIVTPTVKVKLQ